MTGNGATITAASSDAEVIEFVRAWLATALPAEWVKSRRGGGRRYDPGPARRHR